MSNWIMMLVPVAIVAILAIGVWRTTSRKRQSSGNDGGGFAGDGGFDSGACGDSGDGGGGCD